MFNVILTQSAVKDYRKFDKAIRVRIASKLKDYSTDPLRYSVKLSNPALGSNRFRIGDYIVIFDIDEDNIIILRIGHRKDIYLK